MRRTKQDRARRRALADAAVTANTPMTGPPRISSAVLAHASPDATVHTSAERDTMLPADPVIGQGRTAW